MDFWQEVEWFPGEAYNREEWRNLRGSEISMIFQDSGAMMNPTRKVGDVFVEYLRTHEKISKKDAWAKGCGMLEKMNLPSPDNVMKSYPFQLSGGMRQRVGIAMGMSYQPKLLLADEPTGSVDTATSKLILDVFRELNRAMGVTIIIVTHDTKLSAQIDRVVAIRDGKTSTELVRKSGIAKSFGELNEQEETSHEELTVLDRAGQLQIPKEYLEELGLRGGDKVRVELEEGKISIYPRGIADKASK